METREALAVLGLAPGATFDEARRAFRRLVRTHHPDVAGAAATAHAARLTEAYAVLRTVAAGDAAATLDIPVAPGPPVPPPDPAPPGAPVEAELATGDTVWVHAPPDEAYLRLLDAASQVGHIGYVDRHLGIIEAIVRFEGGPSCSLLVTVQGRAGGTEACCTLESIEARPTPPLRPVVDALLDALTHAGT